MSEPVRPGKPGESTHTRRRITGVLVAIATLTVLDGLFPSVAQAQKLINFSTNGSVTSTLVYSNYVSPDLYHFYADSGDRIRLQTSNTSLDTTIRVVGPDASINLFDDDGGGGITSRLVFTAADSGWYVAVVSSYSGNAGVGDYTLSFGRNAFALQPDIGLSRNTEEGEGIPEVYNPEETKPVK